MNRSDHTLQNSFWGLLYRLLHMICPFFLRAVIIRQIGAEYIGLDGLFKSILSMLNLTELGFGAAITYMMYRPVAEGDKATIRQLLTLIRRVYRWIGLIVLTAGVLVIPFLRYLVKNDTGANVNIYLLYGMYLFHTAASYLLFAYRSSLFTAHQRRDLVFKVNTVCSIIQYALQVIVLIFTRNYYLYLLVFSLMIVPQSLGYYFLSRKKFPDLYCEGVPTREQVRMATAKIGALLGHRIGGTLIISIDDIIISAFIGISVLTQYDNYYFILHSIVVLVNVIITSSVASIGNKLSRDSVESAYRLFLRLTYLWIGLIGWCATCLLSLYQPFIRMWVGEKYLFPEGIVVCLSLYFFVWQFRTMGTNMKNAAGLWEQDWAKPYIGMALNTALSILFVRLTGSILGVLLPTMVILGGIYFPWETHVLFQDLFERSSREYVLLVLRSVATILISMFAVYLLIRRIPEAGIGWFLLRILICGTLPPSLYLALNLNSPLARQATGDLLRIGKKLTSRFLKRIH